MIKKIKFHNYIYGNAFSTIEFLIMILVLLPFTIYYLYHHLYLYGLICLGIVLNSALILLFALHSLIYKREEIGIRQFLKKDVRAKILSTYPKLQRETNVLALTVLFPFLLCFLSFLDLLNPKKIKQP